MGREEIITLTLAAYLGSQKFGSLVWSGDIASTFESLSHQVKGAMNMAMCGIPWRNTDIGGFYGGDTTGDGGVTIADVLALIKALLNDTLLENGDLNDDGRISLIDVLRAMKRITK